jgi:NAD(P)-dependent dehydrogenase (short-subunit alcohol dehydrogenase family)
MPLLQDRVAVMTGGTGVLGRAVSRLFVAEGARVAVPYRNDEDAQALRTELGARADALLAERVDATDGAALTRFIAGAVAVFGHLDTLINVIGGFAGGRPLHETDEATWDHMLDLNLRTVYLACHAAVPHLLRTGRVTRHVTVAGPKRVSGGWANRRVFTAGWSSRRCCLRRAGGLSLYRAPGRARGAIPTWPCPVRRTPGRCIGSALGPDPYGH